jgi:NADH-quinone oxidoreductase subunit A
MIQDFVPIAIMLLIASGLSLTFLKLQEFLGPKRPSVLKSSAYESGMDPVGTARDRYSVKFYLVAMIFIVFDVEVVFMYPWAVSFSEFIQAGAGPGSLFVVTVFTIILLIGLLYDIKKGGLNWD